MKAEGFWKDHREAIRLEVDYKERVWPGNGAERISRDLGEIMRTSCSEVAFDTLQRSLPFL